MRWPRQVGGEPLLVTVNVSPRQLRDAGFLEAVRKALTASGLSADRFALDVTESAVMNNPDPARARLEALQALSVRVSIDDVGAGYSSLGRLRHFPFETLKVDTMFMRGQGELLARPLAADYL